MANCVEHAWACSLHIAGDPEVFEVRRSLLFALFLSLGAACTPTAAPVSGSLAEYCAVATRSGLSGWSGDVVTICDGPPAASDHEAPSACALFRVAGAELTPIALPDGVEARLALSAGGKLVVLTTDERLLYGPPAGPLAELSAWAAEPALSEDGARVAYVALADGFTEPELGVPTQIVVHDLAADRREVVTTDELASAPVPVPGSREVLFVSTQTGVASVWRAAPGGAATQLTNVGMTRLEQGFVPVPDRQLAWTGASELVFTARYEDDRIWRLDLSGVAEELGPGAWPRLRADGAVLARNGSGEGCALTYLDGRTP